MAKSAQRSDFFRGRPLSPTTTREQFAYRSIFYRLKVQINLRPIAEQKLKAGSLDRNEDARTAPDYAK